MPYLIAVVAIAILGGAYSIFFSSSSDADSTAARLPEQPAAIANDNTVDNNSLLAREEEINNDPEVIENEPVEEVDNIEPSEEVVAEEIASTIREVYGEAAYTVPRRIVHDIQVSLTLDGTTITDAVIGHDGTGVGVTKSHINFDAAYEPFVIGADINEISLSRVGGATMTSDAFNEVIEEIRAGLEDAV